MDPDSILEVRGLNVVLDGRKILENISFSVRRGEALAIIGPNGAGKSVLLRALLNLEPYTGEIRWESGIRIGYVPQRFAVERSAPVTVREFFLLKSPRFWRPMASFTQHVRQELGLVGLDDSILEKPLGGLSGGQMQRILIAWAMLTHPAALLFDEPTAGVDVGFEETAYHMMRRLQRERGTTILLVSHDLSVVYRHAQTVLCLNRRISCQGPPREVLNQESLVKIYGESGYYQHEHGAGPEGA
jgi:ABC-type Mn2+/Zn2+ transport system ATPase subunit